MFINKVFQSGQPRANLLLTILLALAFVMTLAVVMLSSYLRLHESGAGCTDNWPDCYGFILQELDDDKSHGISVLTPQSPLKKLHRVLASLLVVIILVITYLTVLHSQITITAKRLPWIMLLLLLILSVVGPYTVLKQYPIFATINIICGILLLPLIASLWWEIRSINLQETINSKLAHFKRKSFTGIILFIIVTILGAWSSANYANISTNQLESESLTMLASILDGFNPFRVLQLDTNGRVIPVGNMKYIANAHQIAAVLVTLYLISFSLSLILVAQPLRYLGIAILMLLIIECALGWAADLFSMPLIVLLAHNLLTAILIVLLTKLYFLLRVGK